MVSSLAKESSSECSRKRFMSSTVEQILLSISSVSLLPLLQGSEQLILDSMWSSRQGRKRSLVEGSLEQGKLSLVKDRKLHFLRAFNVNSLISSTFESFCSRVGVTLTILMLVGSLVESGT